MERKEELQNEGSKIGWKNAGHICSYEDAAKEVVVKIA
jgi:hypothetical protein